ncbi:hypothetical protein PZA11_003710 [Diplocarpon coronariae]|uniref:GRIP domain-containing protein n=1 Tax=Diplocarpon coronariae TaxID=2795749 RepID=A0A218YX18_9HELO|nr:hypothetical protein JHW43_007185 [Diplocarpon mali]OWP00357.1 hypothetical protein B2J93_3907 [Marssonina coronariae]
MSAVAPPDTSQTSSSALKKKNNKRKKGAKGKTTGDAVKESEIDKDDVTENGDVEDDENPENSAVNTPRDAAMPESTISQTNGHGHDSTRNGHAVEALVLPASQTDIAKLNDTQLVSGDASARFEAMSQEREALRVEVEKLRRSLENIQGKHTEETFAIKGQHAENLSNIETKHKYELSSIKAQHEEEVSTIRAELLETESAKDHAETQYQSLLGRINTIKSSLGERLKADKQELAEAKEQIEALEAHNESLRNKVTTLENDVKRLEQEAHDASKELSSLRNRHNLSQQNWVNEREDFVQHTKQLKDEAEAAKGAMGDWEVLAMEERSMREVLAEKIKDLEEQFSVQKESYEEAVSERNILSQSLEGLQRALQEVQESRKRELREMVESYEEQLQGLKETLQNSDSRAIDAEATKGALQAEVDRLVPFEKEIKEKNLLVGKLRHEAIILNDHLTKALRYLKKAKPEENIDRQIVTNHFLHFLALDRSDPKKFQILQLIASLLNWTDEQKEQAGLARPGASSSSLRLPVSPFHRTPSTPSLSSEYFTEPLGNKESLADLWTGFLERSAEEGSVGGNTSDSAGSSTVRPDTRSVEGSSRG